MQKNSPAAAPNKAQSESPDLSRYAWISIAAAISTILLKTIAYLLVGSVSLLSDALESVINLVAALIALFALKLAAKPANSRYTFGRSKVEYFSAAVEGSMILVAALLIIISAINRIMHPATLSNFEVGLTISGLSALINGGVGLYLVKVGKKQQSPTLHADGKHLLTDFWTTAGVILGVFLICLTKINIFDPLLAIFVAINITWTGHKLLHSSLAGLMDVTLPDKENQLVIDTLNSFRQNHISFHGLRTRKAGHISYINVDVLVPGDWSVRRGHDFCVEVENALHEKIPHAQVALHLEAIEDPKSYDDIPVGYVPLDGKDQLYPQAPAESD